MNKLWKLWRWLIGPDPRYAGRRLIDPSFEGRATSAFQTRVLRNLDDQRTILEGLMQPLVVVEPRA